MLDATDARVGDSERDPRRRRRRLWLSHQRRRFRPETLKPTLWRSRKLRARRNRYRIGVPGRRPRRRWVRLGWGPVTVDGICGRGIKRSATSPRLRINMYAPGELLARGSRVPVRHKLPTLTHRNPPPHKSSPLSFSAANQFTRARARGKVFTLGRRNRCRWQQNRLSFGTPI